MRNSRVNVIKKLDFIKISISIRKERVKSCVYKNQSKHSLVLTNYMLYVILGNTRNPFDRIKKLFANGFGGLESNYRQRMNLYTDKDLEYFRGEAKNVNVTCIECVALNNCVNLSNFIHPKCKCFYVPIENVNFTCEMALNKISDYLMVDEGKKYF